MDNNGITTYELGFLPSSIHCMFPISFRSPVQRLHNLQLELSTLLAGKRQLHLRNLQVMAVMVTATYFGGYDMGLKLDAKKIQVYD